MAQDKNAALDSQLDSLLGGLLAQGWDDPVEDAVGQVEAPTPLPLMAPKPTPAKREYPPLPVRETPPAPVRSTLAAPARAQRTTAIAETGPADAPQNDEEGAGGMLDIGLLADLASGRKGAVEAAQAAGVTEGELQSALAVALRDMPTEEIAKALGVQAVEQQLKSGAIYGVVLADLVQDMLSGRLKPADKLEFAKLMAKLGRIEPAPDKNALNAGGGFTLNIRIGETASPVIIQAEN